MRENCNQMDGVQESPRTVFNKRNIQIALAFVLGGVSCGVANVMTVDYEKERTMRKIVQVMYGHNLSGIADINKEIQKCSLLGHKRIHDATPLELAMPFGGVAASKEVEHQCLKDVLDNSSTSEE